MRIRAGMIGLALLGAILLTEGFDVAHAAVPYLQLVSVGEHPGQYVLAYGSGFCKAGCSSVTVKVDGRVAVNDIPVDGDGGFRATLSVTEVGEHQVSASQRNAGGHILSASASLNVPVGDAPSQATTSGPAATTTPPPSVTARTDAPKPTAKSVGSTATSVGPAGTQTSPGQGQAEGGRETGHRPTATVLGGVILGLAVLATVAIAVARSRSQATKK
jgi:hypothetical protein